MHASIVLLLLCLFFQVAICSQAQAAPQEQQGDAVIIQNPEQFNQYLDKQACAMQGSVLCVFKNKALISTETMAQRTFWYDYSNCYRATVFPQDIAQFDFELKDNARILAAHLHPELSKQLTERERKALQEAQQRINSLIKPEMNEREKFTALHDDLIRKADYTQEQKGNATDILLDNRGTCEAYSRTLWLLCRMAGIDCHIVYGTAIERHAWNIVCLDNQWYHSDVTWDDPVTVNQPERRVLSHSYFLLSDEEIKADHAWEHQCLPAATVRNEEYFKQIRCYFDTDEALWRALSRAIRQKRAELEVYLKQYGSDTDFTQRLYEATEQYPELTGITGWHGPEKASEGVVRFTFEYSGLPQQADMQNLDLSRGVIIESHRFLQQLDTEEWGRRMRVISDSANSRWKMLLAYLCSVWEVVISWF